MNRDDLKAFFDHALELALTPENNMSCSYVHIVGYFYIKVFVTAEYPVAYTDRIVRNYRFSRINIGIIIHG